MSSRARAQRGVLGHRQAAPRRRRARRTSARARRRGCARRVLRRRRSPATCQRCAAAATSICARRRRRVAHVVEEARECCRAVGVLIAIALSPSRLDDAHFDPSRRRARRRSARAASCECPAPSRSADARSRRGRRPIWTNGSVATALAFAARDLVRSRARPSAQPTRNARRPAITDRLARTPGSVTPAALCTAARIRTYVPQRQMLPASECVDLVVGRLRARREQRRRGHDLPGLAITALRHARARSTRAAADDRADLRSS